MSDVGYIYVAEITYWDGAAEQTLYVANTPFATGLGDTPQHTICEPRLLQPALMQRDAFDAQRTSGRSRVGVGDLVLANDGDGALDFLLNGTSGVDGRQLVVRRGKPGAAYPAGFTQVFKGTMAYATGDAETVTIKIRDQQQALLVPFQPTKFAGNNVLPAGLEGTSELAGKPKPVTLGQVFNITPPCVNTSKLIYQVHDGAATVTAVRDRGVSLTASASAWTPQTSGFGANDIIAITVGGGLFVIGGAGGKIATSPDGVTWTARANPFAGTDTIWALCYANGRFVAVGDGGKIATSPDGVTWTARTSGVAYLLQSVAYGNGLFVAVGGDSAHVLTSPDGITWTPRATGLAAGHVLGGVAFGNGLWLTVDLNSPAFATSPDGVTWTARTLLGTAAYAIAVFLNTQFFTADGSGIIATSDDGLAFSERRTSIPTPGKAVRGYAFGNGRYLYVGDSGALATSPDGQSWTLQPSGVTTRLFAGAFANNTFVVVGAAGVVLTSTAAGAYASLADLLDDTKAPARGTFKVYSAADGTYFRLGSIPAGAPTCDVVEGATAADRTTAQVFKRLLQRGGFTVTAGDIAALDATNSAPVGLFIDSETTFDAAADAVASGAWCSWGADAQGALRIQQFALPSGAPVVTWVRDDLTNGPLTPIESSDDGAGLPTYQSILTYAKNYTPQSTDLAGAVDAATRAVLAQPSQSVKATDAAVQTAHPLALQTTEDSCFVNAADAQAEVNRRQVIRGTPRRWFRATVDWDDTNVAVDVNSVVQIANPRYGLSGGALFRVLGVQPNAADNSLTCLVWG